MRATIASLLVGLVLATASVGSWADGAPRPDALLMVDQHREAIVERVIKAWPEALTAEQASVLRGTLAGLRADRLLAISISPGLGSLLGVLRGVDRIEADKGSLAAIKALGDAAADLAYTPVTPCRLFDTRVSQGGLGTPTVGVRRTYGAITPVASQGGTGGCAAVSGAAVALIQIGTLTPSGHGLLQGGPQGAASFPNALILYQPGDQYGTAVAMPLNLANGEFDLLEQFATADLYGDLLGYFKPPGDATSLDIKVAGQRVMRYEYNANSPNVIGGSPANRVTTGVYGATIFGGGISPWGTYQDPNQVEGPYGTVAGGVGNVAGFLATVGGGIGNTAIDEGSTVAGGRYNRAMLSVMSCAEVDSMRRLADTAQLLAGATTMRKAAGALSGAGEWNGAIGHASVITGGSENQADGHLSFVGGGTHNMVGGEYAAIAGGWANQADGEASFSAGSRNRVTAAGRGSVAMGRLAVAEAPGCFVFGDDSQPLGYYTPVTCTAANQAKFRVFGGVWFFTGGTGDATYTGAHLPAGSGCLDNLVG